MLGIALPNSLLRLDGTKGQPPSPFERPNDNMDFFVLELGEHRDVESWCACVTKAIDRNREVLCDLIRTGAKATLFVECGSLLPVLRLEAPFLSTLAEVGISLEFCRD